MSYLKEIRVGKPVVRYEKHVTDIVPITTFHEKSEEFLLTNNKTKIKNKKINIYYPLYMDFMLKILNFLAFSVCLSHHGRIKKIHKSLSFKLVMLNAE